MSVDDVTEILSIPLLGIIPDDEQVVIGTNQGTPVISIHSVAGTAYRNICRRLLGEEVEFLDLNHAQSFLTDSLAGSVRIRRFLIMKKTSVPIAKERLEALVVSDRIHCKPEEYEMICKELYKTLSKYMAVAEDEMRIHITRSEIHIQLMGEQH